jgi:hypothetical protein
VETPPFHDQHGANIRLPCPPAPPDLLPADAGELVSQDQQIGQRGLVGRKLLAE